MEKDVAASTPAPDDDLISRLIDAILGTIISLLPQMTVAARRHSPSDGATSSDLHLSGLLAMSCTWFLTSSGVSPVWKGSMSL
jgi:hypothetical protein